MLLHSLEILRGDKLDHIVNSEDSDGSFGSELERLDFGHGGLEHTSLEVVADLSLNEVKTGVLELFLLSLIVSRSLGGVVEDTELGNQVSGVLGGVHGEDLGDDEESFGELSDSELLAGAEGTGEVVEVDGEGDLNGTTSSDEGVRLEDTLGDAEGVVDGALNLFEEVLVGTTDDNGLGTGVGHAFEEHVFPVSDSSLLDLGAGSEVLGAVDLLTIHIGEGDNDGGTSLLGNTAQVGLLDSADGNNTSLNEVLEGEIVDTAGAENDVGAGLDDLLASLLADVHLSLSDFVKVVGVLNENLHSHLETELVEVEVNAGNLGVLHNLGHALGGASGLNGVAVDKLGLPGGLSVCLEDVNGLDGVLGLTLGVGGLDVVHGLDNHTGEEVGLGAEKLGAHGGLGGVEDGILTEGVGLDTALLLDKSDGLLEGKTVTRHNRSGVNLVLHQLVGSLQELSGEDDNGGGSVTDFTVLDLGELAEDLGCGVGDLELLEDSGAIVGDGDIADVVDEHLVETLGSEG